MSYQPLLGDLPHSFIVVPEPGFALVRKAQQGILEMAKGTPLRQGV